MEKLKRYIVPALVITALVIGGGWAFWAYRDIIVRRDADQERQATSRQLEVTEKTVTDNAPPLKITIAYPNIAGLDGFNEAVERITQEELRAFRQIALENDQAIRETDPESYAQYPREYYLDIGHAEGRIDNGIVSTVLGIETYTGGAHGAHYFASVNWDVENDRELALQDLFPNNPNYLKTVSDYAITDLERQLQERMGDASAGWIADGAGPAAENFQVFLVTNDSIVFYFPEYQVAPYAAGSFTVTMPRQ